MITLLDKSGTLNISGGTVIGLGDKASFVHNGSGELSIVDVTLIQRYLAGFSTTYPVGEFIKTVPATETYELPIVD